MLRIGFADATFRSTPLAKGLWLLPITAAFLGARPVLAQKPVHVGTCPPKPVVNACAGPSVCTPDPVYGGHWTFGHPLPKGTACTAADLPAAAHATCTGTGICGAPAGPAGTMTPKYIISAIIYAPPGNASYVQYSNAVATGSTSGKSTTQGGSFTAGVTGNFIFTDTVSSSTTKTTSTQVTNTVTHTIQVSSTSDVLDHGKDTFYILVHPTFAYSQTYPGAPISIASNPSNSSLVPLILDVNELLGKEPIIASKKAQMLDLTSADLAAMASADPFIGSAGKLNQNRFQLVDHIQLAGPDYAGADIDNAPYTEADSTTTCKTTADTFQNTVTIGFSAGADFLGQGEKAQFTASMIDGYASTSGACNGTTVTAALSPKSTTVGYEMPVDVYEDNVFHTFAFVEPFNFAAINAAGVWKGVVNSSDGKPAAKKLLTIVYPNGTTHHIWTKSDGSFVLAMPPTGTIAIESGTEKSGVTIRAGQKQATPVTLHRVPQTSK